MPKRNKMWIRHRISHGRVNQPGSANPRDTDHAVLAASRRAKSGKVTHKGRKSRIELRYHRLRLPVPKGSAEEALHVWAIHLCEVLPPDGAGRIEWYLLTATEITTVEEAQQLVKYYTLRWRVENICRVLKTGSRACSGHRPRTRR